MFTKSDRCGGGGSGLDERLSLETVPVSSSVVGALRCVAEGKGAGGAVVVRARGFRRHTDRRAWRCRRLCSDDFVRSPGGGGQAAGAGRHRRRHLQRPGLGQQHRHLRDQQEQAGFSPSV